MRRYKVLAAAIALGFGGCDDSGTNATIDDIIVESAIVSISANLEPPVSSNPVRCHVQVVLSNRSAATMHWRLAFPIGEVILKSTKENLGTIRLATPWDGVLLPGERDSIWLAEADSTAANVRITCGERVYMKLSLYEGGNRIADVTTSESIFHCVH
jgi:hypothetical protein